MFLCCCCVVMSLVGPDPGLKSTITAGVSAHNPMNLTNIRLLHCMCTMKNIVSRLPDIRVSETIRSEDSMPAIFT